MFISVAAASIDKYTWYQYKGRKTLSFDDHHHKYALDLETGTKFGIRKYGGKLKLAVLADPRIVFTLSEDEVTKVVRLSAGYSGTVQGMKLKAGTGGKDVKRKERQHDPDGELDPKYYPPVPMPPKKADIMRLYHYFNKLHFKGECPDKIKITFPDALKFRAQAQTRLRNGAPEFTLKLSKVALTDPKRVIYLILHEMIHLLHHKRYFVDGDVLYQHAGHGPLFLEEMHRLNKFGYGIDTKEFDLIEAELVTPEYVMLLELSNGQTVILHSAKDFADKVDTLRDKLRLRIDTSVGFSQLIYGTTQSSYVYEGIRLTRSGGIPKSRRLMAHTDASKVLTSIKKDIKVKREDDLTPVRGDVREVVASAIDFAVDIIDRRLTAYLSNILVYAKLIGSKDARFRGDVLELGRELLTPAEFDLVQKRWNGIEDRHLLNSHEFRFMRRDLLKHKLDKKAAVNWLADNWEHAEYRGRVDAHRYAQLCIQAFGDIITLPDDKLEQELAEALQQYT